MHEGCLIVTELHLYGGQVPQSRGVVRVDVQSGAEGLSGFFLPAERQKADSIIGEPRRLGGTTLPQPARGEEPNQCESQGKARQQSRTASPDRRAGSEEPPV